MLFILNRKNIVIKRRLPYLLMTDQLLCYTVGLMTIFNGPCIPSHAVSCLTLLITFIRTTYIYEFLSLDQQLGCLRIINRLFWNKDHLFRKKSACIIGIITIIISLLTTVIYAVLNDIYDESCNSFPSILAALQIILFLLLEFMYVVIILFKGLHERIGLRSELFGRFFTFVSLLIGFGVVRIFRPVIHIDSILQVSSYIFWGTWYPLIYICVINIKLRKIRLSGLDYNFTSLEEVGKQFFCLENVKFLRRFNEFKENDRDERLLFELLTDFVYLGSKYQLNLSQELRNNVIADPTEIDLVYHEVFEMVRDNLLPYASL